MFSIWRLSPLSFSWRRFFSPDARRAAAIAALALTLTLCAPTPLLSQDSLQRSSASESILRNWSELYAEGQNLLQAQSGYLEGLRAELSNLQTGYGELTGLYEALSQSNESLKVFNEQIARRMQERDEDLYHAYQEIGWLERELARYAVIISRLTVALVGLVSLVLGAAVLKAALRAKLF